MGVKAKLLPVLYPLGTTVETCIPQSFSSYLKVSDKVARADLDAQ